MKATHTPLRSVRIPDALWNAAQAKADEQGESVSDVIRKALEQYVKPRKPRPDLSTERIR